MAVKPVGQSDSESAASPTIGGTLKTGAHLVRRFVGSLSSRPPSETDETWALDLLNTGQVQVWQQMSPQDQRHAIAVARDVSQRLSEVEGPAMASDWFDDAEQFRRAAAVAALLHDCGKIVSDMGTFARAGATVLWAVVPDDKAEDWQQRSGARRRLAEYRMHPTIGADLLRAADSQRLIHTWAAEHHQRRETWTVPEPIGVLLKECDDD